MVDALDDDGTPNRVTVSKRLLAYLEAEGEGDLVILRSLLEALVAAAESVELPAPESDELSDVRGPPLNFSPRRRFPTLGEYEVEGEGYFADNDIAEIAEDLADALAQYAAGEADALWEWRFGHETHWGVHHVTPLLTHLETLD